MPVMIKVLILAVLQGVAEFLPISSSGHLVIAQRLFGIDDGGLRLDVCLHFGTLLSIVVFYRHTLAALFCGCFVRGDAGRAARGFVGKIIVSALPAVAAYALFSKQMDALFGNVRMVGALLMFTGAMLAGSRYLPCGSREVSWLRAIAMGIAQAVALLPGVSRSGMTIVAARTARVESNKSAEFSFLMSAPLIAGGMALEIAKEFFCDPVAATGSVPNWLELAAGTVVAAFVGYFAIAMLVRALKGRWFWLFGPYCAIVGLATLLCVR